MSSRAEAVGRHSRSGAAPQRRARRDDLDALVALWLALCEHHAELSPQFRLGPEAAQELRRQLADQLGDPDQACFVADAPEGGLAGFCTVRVDRAAPILDDPLRAEILDLFVRPARRRAGLGAALLEAALAWLRARGIRRVEVRVLTRNAVGQRFWRAHGFGSFVDVLERAV